VEIRIKRTVFRTNAQVLSRRTKKWAKIDESLQKFVLFEQKLTKIDALWTTF